MLAILEGQLVKPLPLECTLPVRDDRAVLQPGAFAESAQVQLVAEPQAMQPIHAGRPGSPSAASAASGSGSCSAACS
jgi:hypothetical protein